jgi:hypothetical protein
VPDQERIDVVVTPIDITPRPEDEPPGRGRQRWPQQRLALTILAVLAAYGLGIVTAQRDTTSPKPTDQVANVVATGIQCSVQNGKTLQVGIEVANRGGAAAAIRSVQANAPLGALNLRDVGWGACGQVQPAPVGSTDGQPLRLIPAGGSEWMYARFDVVVDCPAPYPVEFLLDSVGSTSLLDVGGFNDLGNVPYTGCT